MARHIHMHLHTTDAGTSEGAKKAAQTRKAHSGGSHLPVIYDIPRNPGEKPGMTRQPVRPTKTPTSPPSPTITPTSNAPHNPPKNTSGVKSAKATTSVIKPVKGGLNVATKGVNLINKTLRKAGELSESKY